MSPAQSSSSKSARGFICPTRQLIPIAALLSILSVFALAYSGWTSPEGRLGGLEARLLDFRYALRGPTAAPETVVVVALDDATLEKAARFPIPRGMLAQAVRKIAERAPAAIAIDLMFTEYSGKAVPANDDLALAGALAESDADILAVALGGSRAAVTRETLIALAYNSIPLVDGPFADDPDTGARAPAAAFAAASELAHVNVALDQGGALRRMHPAQLAPGGFYLPALPLSAARKLMGEPRSALRLTPGEAIYIGPRRIPIDPRGTVLAHFYGPRASVRTLSLIDVIENGAPEDLAGKAVFIGATATGYGDRFATPYDPQLPGVEALATFAANIITNGLMTRDARTRLTSLAGALAAAILACFAAANAQAWRAGVALAAVFAAVLAGAHIAFLRNLWLDATLMIAAAVLGGVLGAAARRIAQRRREESLAQRGRNLAQYHSPLLTEALASASAPVFDGRPQTAAALFVDVAGYTARSERLGPEGAAVFLKAFHTAVERAVLAHNGVIEQFAGDGAMAIFGLPNPRPDDAARALGCAEALFRETAALNAALAETGEPAAHIRIGIHYGPAVAAVLGGVRHAHVTVTGETVNLASRLQDLAKTEGVALAVSDALWRAAGPVARAQAQTIAAFERRPGIVLRGAEGTRVCWLAPAPQFYAAAGR